MVLLSTAMYYIKETACHLLNVKENLSSLPVCEISLFLQASYQIRPWDMSIAPSPIRPKISIIHDPIRNCPGQNYNWLNCPVVISSPSSGNLPPPPTLLHPITAVRPPSYIWYQISLSSFPLTIFFQEGI